MAKQSGEEKAIERTEPTTPRPADAFIESGWSHYSKKDFPQAVEEFQKALDLEPDNIDTMYALGMSQEAGGRIQEATHTFEKVISLLEAGKLADPVRSLMLTRLAHGHINHMRTGDWKMNA